MIKILSSLGIVLMLFLLPQGTLAASLYFDPQETTVGTNSTFQIGLNVTASTSINTLSTSIVFPKGFHPTEVSDGNSIINIWIDKPIYDDLSHTLKFSGIIPGGFSGVGGRLILITVQAERPGVGIFTMDQKHSAAYQNGPSATPEPLTLTPLEITALAEKDNVTNNFSDTLPPDSFIPTLVQLPVDSGGQQWALAFSTTDKGSGIDHYEVLESEGGIYGWFAKWKVAESPYVLEDQDLHHVLSVRAVDGKGNEITETLPAPYPLPWYAHTWIAILALTVGILVAALLRRISR